MRFFYDNLIDYAAVVLTPSSQQTNLPAVNVQNEFRKKIWRTGSAAAAETLVIDLGSAKAVTALILLDHTLTAGDSLIKIEGNATNTWGAPSFSQALTWASGTIAQTFSVQTYRYWRLSFTKSAAGETRDIGRVFLGPYYETEEAPDFDGYDDETIDNSRKIKSVSGQTYVDVQDSFGQLKLSFSQVAQAVADGIKTVVDSVGQNKSLFVQVETSSPLNKYWYVKFDSVIGKKVAGVDSGYFWDLKALQFEEQL